MKNGVVTKREVFVAVREYFANGGATEVAGIDVDTILDVIDKTVEQLDKKNEASKKRAAEKRAQGDEVRAAVEAVLTAEVQTIDEIVAKVEVEGVEITRNKVIARLSQLRKAGKVDSADMKVGDRKVKGYFLTEADVATDEDAE